MRRLSFKDHPTHLHPRPFHIPSLLVLCAVALAGCGDSPSAPREVVRSLRVTPGEPVMMVGEVRRLIAVPLSASGAALAERAVAWTSSHPQRATVTGDGTVTALAEGIATLVATSETVRAEVRVVIEPIPAAGIVLDLARLDLVEAATAGVVATVLDSLDRPLAGRTITWTSDDAAVATVDAAGMVTAVSAGSARILARHGTLEASLTIDVRPDLVADVVFDAHDASGGFPWVYQLGLGGAPAVPTKVFGSSGTWEPTASPDGSRLAFACQEVFGPSICTANRDGTNLKVLTGDANFEDQPSWSPDGARIAFRRWAPGGSPGQFNQTDIWVMDADGANPVNLTADAAVQHGPAWSPVQANGRYRVVFSEESIVDGYLLSRLWSVYEDGTSRTGMTTGGAYLEEQASWSPDGLQLVHVRTGGSAGGDLWIVDLLTGAERQLMPDDPAGAQASPSWSPDGRHILFISTHEPSDDGAFRPQLYTVRADGTEMRRRSADAMPKQNAAWITRP
ncbi:MAG: Ig-like domain-containing protein [Gemmatimonadaceae bacterium]